MQTWLIRCTRIAHIRDLDHVDRDNRPWGLYSVVASDKRSALDIFARKSGVRFPADFEVVAWPSDGGSTASAREIYA